MGFLNFLKYNNLVPITVAVLLLGASGAYAAANPEAVYSANRTVVSIDNTYLVHRDLSNYTPKVRILHVTEDEEHYFVSYIFSTIALVDHVWQDADAEEMLKVAKAALGPYGDLGLYVTAQLKQRIDRELALLRETQEIERRQVSSKVVATAYSGLIGAFLDATTETLPGYTPVVEAPSIARPTITPPEREPTQLPEPPPSRPQEPEEEPQEPPAEDGPEEEPEGDTEAPVLQLLGGNPARVEAGGSYADLGAVATDNSNESLEIRYFVNGAEAQSVAIDTTAPAQWVVRYEATDSAGNTGVAERVVEVYAPPSPDGGGNAGGDAPTTTPAEPEPEPASTSTQSTPEPQPAPEPEPQPEPQSEPEPEPDPVEEGGQEESPQTP